MKGDSLQGLVFRKLSYKINTILKLSIIFLNSYTSFLKNIYKKKEKT